MDLQPLGPVPLVSVQSLTILSAAFGGCPPVIIIYLTVVNHDLYIQAHGNNKCSIFVFMPVSRASKARSCKILGNEVAGGKRRISKMGTRVRSNWDVAGQRRCTASGSHLVLTWQKQGCTRATLSLKQQTCKYCVQQVLATLRFTLAHMWCRLAGYSRQRRNDPDIPNITCN